MAQLTTTELASINNRVAALTQAMLGSISPNFRAVSIELTPTTVNLHFLLERECDADREEIDDIVFEYEALELGPPDSRKVLVSVVVSADDTPFLGMPGRRVFGRKEVEAQRSGHGVISSCSGGSSCPQPLGGMHNDATRGRAFDTLPQPNTQYF